MAVDDALGTVTICRRGRLGLYADDHSVTVRNAASRTRRFAWAEVSHFADGSVLNEAITPGYCSSSCARGARSGCTAHERLGVLGVRRVCRAVRIRRVAEPEVVPEAR